MIDALSPGRAVVTASTSWGKSAKADVFVVGDLLLLSEQNICASAGAACSSGSLEPSHVLRAMGVPDRIAHGAIRFSLSRFTAVAELDAALSVLPSLIARLRAVLPVG